MFMQTRTMQGEQNPQARALLASLMSLASVESPAMVPEQTEDQKEGQDLKEPASKRIAQGVGKAPVRVEESAHMPDMASGSFTEGAPPFLL